MSSDCLGPEGKLEGHREGPRRCSGDTEGLEAEGLRRIGGKGGGFRCHSVAFQADIQAPAPPIYVRLPFTNQPVQLLFRRLPLSWVYRSCPFTSLCAEICTWCQVGAPSQPHSRTHSRTYRNSAPPTYSHIVINLNSVDQHNGLSISSIACSQNKKMAVVTSRTRPSAEMFMRGTGIWGPGPLSTRD